MADMDPQFDLSDESSEKSVPWKPILIGVVVVGLIAAFLVWYTSSDQKNTAQINALQQQLDADSAALQTQKDKVVQLTQKLDSMKVAILMKQVPNSKKAVEEYNKLAAEQRADREQYKVMADQYNQKVQKMHDLQP